MRHCLRSTPPTTPKTQDLLIPEYHLSFIHTRYYEFSSNMAPALLNYLGFGASPPKDESKLPVRALPASWYTSQEMYELERRAIFSKRWQLITHRVRLSEPGNWLRYDVAGFEIVVCKDREGKINAFHNVCRHRAFPIVVEEQGTSKIFSCKYHGWSYGLNGKLAKAPGYQELDDFDKSKNGLLPIHVHIDHNGFVWVNLDSNEEPEIAWDDDLKGADTQERFSYYDFSNYTYNHTWSLDDAFFNWKLAGDNYNECYHCLTTHPDLPAIADLATYSVNTQRAWIQHDAKSTPKQIEAGLKVASTYFNPNASMNVTPHFFFIQRVVPKGPTSTSMRYEVYRNNDSSDEDFELVDAMYKRVMSEDKYLCNLAQKNLNAGIFVNGELHPRMEKGPLYFQNYIREAVQSHHKREQVAKQEIWPARQKATHNTMVSGRDVDFCSGLACQTNQEGLAW